MTLSAKIGITWPSVQIDVDLDVDPGCTLAIMGPNGAGKSTILRALAGLLPIHSGCIRSGEVIWDDPVTRSFTSVGDRNIGLVFQDHVLFGHMTVLDNVAFGPRARGQSVREARRVAGECLERFDLTNLANVRPFQLSGGQSQRVALARALVNRPELVLLDEPLASLDVVTRRHMRAEIARDLDAHGPMTILVTHDPDDARHLADSILVIEGGRIVQHGSPNDLEKRPATPYIAELFRPS